MAQNTQVETEALSPEALAAAQERLRVKGLTSEQPAQPAAPPLTLTPEPAPRTRSAGRGKDGKGVLLQLTADQYAALLARAAADRRDVTDYVRICVEDRFEAFADIK